VAKAFLKLKEILETQEVKTLIFILIVLGFAYVVFGVPIIILDKLREEVKNKSIEVVLNGKV
jgi:hypothetical protein